MCDYKENWKRLVFVWEYSAEQNKNGRRRWRYEGLVGGYLIYWDFRNGRRKRWGWSRTCEKSEALVSKGSSIRNSRWSEQEDEWIKEEKLK